MTTIVMVVNNAGSTDGKVVKTAEYLVNNGCDVQVVCLYKDGLPFVELINNVLYRRFPLKVSIKSALIALKPSLFRFFIRKKIYEKKTSKANVTGISSNKEHVLVKSKKISDSFLFKLAKKIFSDEFLSSLAKNVFRNTTLYPIVLRGCYFSTFYNVLYNLEPDYFHAHELDVLESCVLAAENKKTKVIYDSHELERFRNLPWSKRAMKIRGDMEGEYIKKVDKVITVSPGITNKIKEIYKINNVITIRNTPTLKFVEHEIKQNLRKKLGLPTTIPLIVYTGLITFNRGVEDIINSLKYLPDYHLSTVGPCNEEVMEKLTKLVIELELTDRVHFVDKVTPVEVVSFISSGDISVIPIKDSCLSYKYCLPNKLFEAMFAKLPIVASDLPDMRYVIETYKSGEVYTDPSPECIADTIRMVYKNRDKYTNPEMVSKIKNELIFEKEAEKLSILYMCKRDRSA